MAVKVLTDSTSYINEDIIKELDIKVVSLNVIFDTALDLARHLKEYLNMEIGVCSIGPVIGVHVGPGAIGVAYYCDKALR